MMLVSISFKSYRTALYFMQEAERRLNYANSKGTDTQAVVSRALDDLRAAVSLFQLEEQSG